MSIASALNNAISGLTASSRAAEVVSNNVANALTPGFARRELQLSARALGAQTTGVRVDGVVRAQNLTVLADRRLADAEAGNAAVKADVLARLEGAIGTTGDPGSLSARIADLEAALVTAASRPDSEARLQTLVTAAAAVTGYLNALTDEIQAARMEADKQVAAEVGALNDALGRIDLLNEAIVSERAAGRDTSALVDQRQLLVDRVSAIVPVHELARENGQIALYSTGGAILLEGNTAVVGFAAVGLIVPEMTIGSGALSGLTLNGTVVDPRDGGVLGGGTLSARFAVRDEIAVTAQAQIDALARDLIGRLADPAVDPTLASGDPGLFTDAGAAFDPVAETGLAGRLRVSALVDPAQGGALWRLRDGLNAAAPGDVGDARLIRRLTDALTAPQVPASGSFIGAARSVSGLAADVLSGLSSARQSAEDRQSYASARQSALTELQLQDGVDTDAEMQSLLLIEQSYAANARVIQSIDAMIQQILEL